MTLLDQVRDVMRRKCYSIRTEHAYLNWIKQSILFHKKCHQKDMGEKERESFQDTRKLSVLSDKDNEFFFSLECNNLPFSLIHVFILVNHTSSKIGAL